MKKTDYAPIDWRTTPRPTQAVSVRLRIVQIIAFAVLAFFFGGISLIILTSRHALSARDIVLPGIFLSLVGFVGFLLFNSRRKAARELNAGGITRGDGRHFDWNEFRGINVITRKRVPSAPPYIWRVEFFFDGGETAWLIPQQVKNHDEVFGYVSTLPRVQPLTGAFSAPPAS